ncbi:hypothetical protein C8P63_12811 [Melghirimyces profundicolus]|uniref:Uncharacterized protein n=1 Tax=Melghirimyces profundicolus TaxID=1242148 RepID=A0A2T6BC48_9BACL|nr:hypothetical protein C8P63_12811 [Melghirimyces profundicolus]
MWIKGLGVFLCLLLLSMCTHVPEVHGSVGHLVIR